MTEYSYYVIQRIDGKFVAPPGSEHSYTDRLQDARIYRSPEEAERDRCPENENVVPLHAVMKA